jgi:hypothetical protein
VLSHEEQRAWDEIRRGYAMEAEEPARPVLDPTVRRTRSSTPVALRAAVVAGGCFAVLLVVLGAPVAGLAIAVATVPQWLLWRCWPLLDGGVRPPAVTAPRDVLLDREGHPSSGESCRRTPGTT